MISTDGAHGEHHDEGMLGRPRAQRGQHRLRLVAECHADAHRGEHADAQHHHDREHARGEGATEQQRVSARPGLGAEEIHRASAPGQAKLTFGGSRFSGGGASSIFAGWKLNQPAMIEPGNISRELL